MQPKATTCSGTSGTISSTAAVMSFSIAASVAGEMSGELYMRDSKKATPGRSMIWRHSCSSVWSVASTTRPMAARAITPSSMVKGSTV